MKYFSTLPNIVTTDNQGKSLLYKNLLVRTQLIPQLANNPLIFYKYAIQDGETPEIIADKYYGDSFRYWMVLYGNSNILDPQWNWPLSSKEFTLYLENKYAEAANGSSNVLSYTQSTAHHYEKIISTIDGTTNTTAVKNIEIDLNTFLNTQFFNETQTFSDGSTVTYTISKKEVSIYDYEVNTNEAKRNINIINNAYATALETQFQSLVNS